MGRRRGWLWDVLAYGVFGACLIALVVAFATRWPSEPNRLPVLISLCAAVIVGELVKRVTGIGREAKGAEGGRWWIGYAAGVGIIAALALVLSDESRASLWRASTLIDMALAAGFMLTAQLLPVLVRAAEVEDGQVAGGTRQRGASIRSSLGTWLEGLIIAWWLVTPAGWAAVPPLVIGFCVALLAAPVLRMVFEPGAARAADRPGPRWLAMALCGAALAGVAILSLIGAVRIDFLSGVTLWRITAGVLAAIAGLWGTRTLESRPEPRAS